jgi:hypothetical protein
MTPLVLAAALLSAAGTTYRSGDPAIDALQPLLAQTLEANRKTFAGATGVVRGFGAGAAYPQVWIRDSATLLPLTRWHYDRAHLATWLEEHLAHQNADGSLNDWVAAGDAPRFVADAPRTRVVHREPGRILSADRNTSSADQESSAIDAARVVYAATGDRAWLGKPIRGRTVLDRLDAALSFVAGRRMSDGLVTAAFTADWGDVSPAHADQRVIYLDADTPVVAGLYATALYVRAARALAELHDAGGRSGRAALWRARAEASSAAVNARLWQPRRGFYRLHLPVSSPPGWSPPDDADIFALGGNALAALHGIAGDAQAARLMDVAEARRRAYRMATIGGVLLPPYPAGVFRHPILREPFTYQNGGQWEWWAGRFVLAEFERGRAARAFAHLRALASRAVAAGGLHEWITRDGHGRGSARYAGSAAAIGNAILHGLFGLDLDAGALRVTSRLGARSGEIDARQPATGDTVSYRQRYDARARTLAIEVASSARGAGRLAILLPPGASPSRLRVDGRPRPRPAVRAVGGDRYVDVELDWSPHVVELALR